MDATQRRKDLISYQKKLTKYIIVHFKYVNEKICLANKLPLGSLRVDKRGTPGTNKPIVCDCRDEALGVFQRNKYSAEDTAIILESDYESDQFAFWELLQKVERAFFRHSVDTIARKEACCTSVV